MERQEVIEVFKLIKSVYPNFEVTTEKVDQWARLMKRMDYVRVMKKCEHHVMENKFPPTIAEIAAYAPEENNHLDKIEKWKQEASQVPESKKLEFQKKMQELIKGKRHEP